VNFSCRRKKFKQGTG